MSGALIDAARTDRTDTDEARTDTDTDTGTEARTGKDLAEQFPQQNRHERRRRRPGTRGRRWRFGAMRGGANGRGSWGGRRVGTDKGHTGKEAGTVRRPARAGAIGSGHGQEAGPSSGRGGRGAGVAAAGARGAVRPHGDAAPAGAWAGCAGDDCQADGEPGGADQAGVRESFGWTQDRLTEMRELMRKQRPVGGAPACWSGGY